MKTFRTFLLFLTVGSFASYLPAATVSEHLGLQLWSVRVQIKENVPAALDQVKSFGFTEVETAGTADLPVEQFAQLLHARGLQAVSAHFGYDRLKQDIEGAIREAKALGAQFLICPVIPHKDGFDEAAARRAAADFNTWGAACKAAGLRFGYHPHGFEFTPTAAGNGETVFDVLIRESKSDLVCFEMDVFWVAHAGQNPVKLLLRYPDRWVLLHVKDLRQGAATGLSTGKAAPTDNVPVGSGQIDWPAVFRTAANIGVQHYFIEDESPAPVQNIPLSLRYLRALKP